MATTKKELAAWQSKANAVADHAMQQYLEALQLIYAVKGLAGVALASEKFATDFFHSAMWSSNEYLSEAAKVSKQSLAANAAADSAKGILSAAKKSRKVAAKDIVSKLTTPVKVPSKHTKAELDEYSVEIAAMPAKRARRPQMDHMQAVLTIAVQDAEKKAAAKAARVAKNAVKPTTKLL